MDVLEILRDAPNDLLSVARVAAIPNSLDVGLLHALLEDTVAPGAGLQALNEAGLLTGDQNERFIVHPLFRDALLATWWQDIPAFRRKCQRGYEYLARKSAESNVETSLPVLQELTYFALGAALPAGLELLDLLYAAPRSRHQLGVCEQLLSSLRVLEPALLLAELDALHYFQADLALAYYKLDEAQQAFRSVADEAVDPLRRALAELGLGRAQLAQHQWQLAFQSLHQAESTLAKLGRPAYRAAAQMTIGIAFDDLAERSGGLYSGNEDTADPLARVQRSLNGLLWAVITALLRTRPLSALYFGLGLNPRLIVGRMLTALYVGGNYQDWVIARLKVEATRWLRSAAGIFDSLGMRGELADARDRLVILYHQLGHRRQARQLQETLLSDSSLERSEYWQARVRLARGQIRAESGQWAEALNDLNPAYDVLSQYVDWERAGTAAQLGGQVRLRTGNLRGAAVSFRNAAECFRQAQDLLRQTEALVALGNISNTTFERETLGFIDRFPGDLSRRVRRTSLFSINGLTWLGTLVVVLLVGFTTIVIETLILFYTQGIQVSFSVSDIITLASTPFLPLLLIWSYRLIYTIIGGAFWAYRLPLGTIESDSPEIIVLSSQEISRQNVERKRFDGIPLTDLLGLISAERQLLGQLVRLGSSLIAVSRDQVFPIEAKTRFYKALKMGIFAQRAAETQWFSADLDYVKSWWFIAQVAASLAIGILVFVQPLRALPATCPDPAQCLDHVVYVHVTSKLTGALVSFVLLTPFVLSLRARLQGRQIKHALGLLRRS